MKKGGWISLLALFTAIVGIVVAIAAFMKKKGKTLKDDLEFDDSIYFEDDSDDDDDTDTDDLEELSYVETDDEPQVDSEEKND
ncbi:MAG: hypothetical protein K0R90_1834 [Oscillospiraceae bacterium]|jgi:hypothetical protein|nr:hypothetical protein [Oscillospiraceae bacterium]